MLIYPNIDPVALQIGPLKIYWYGLMYAVSFVIIWKLALQKTKRLQKEFLAAKNVFTLSSQQIIDLIFYTALGTVIGGRVGQMLFYDLDEFLHNPLLVFQIWQGGMSFHGGFIGISIGLLLFARKIKTPFFTITDFIIPFAPIGLFLGRIANFINSELLGRVTTVPWGIVYPNGGPLPRHPSQLYEATAEGLLLFIILWLYSQRPRPPGTTTSLFIFGYGVMRFFCEFFRMPDDPPGIILGFFSMGQLLSLPMIIIGLGMFIYFYRRQQNIA